MANIQIAKPSRKGEPPKAADTVQNLAKPRDRRQGSIAAQDRRRRTPGFSLLCRRP